MKQYNIDKLSKEDVFGGRLITPMRQWLKMHNIETKKYDYNADIATITHYLQNKDYPEGDLYREEALILLEKYYRATHTGLNDNDAVDQEQQENLFAEIFNAPVYRKFNNILKA